MELKVLGSGSSGNCYILENDNEALIIEAGLPFMEVKKALNFNVMKIKAVLVSHTHPLLLFLERNLQHFLTL